MTEAKEKLERKDELAPLEKYILYFGMFCIVFMLPIGIYVGILKTIELGTLIARIMLIVGVMCGVLVIVKQIKRSDFTLTKLK